MDSYCNFSAIVHHLPRFVQLGELEFLRTLTQLTSAPVDGLVGAVLRHLYEIRNADSQWLIQAGRKLSLILKDDYDRLRAILDQCKYEEHF